MTEASRISVDRIKQVVAAEFDVSVRDLESARRDLAAIRPRHVAISLALRLTPHSSGVVGRLFGGRDHSTVLNARRRIQSLRSADAAFDRRCRRLEADLEPPGRQADPVQLAFLDGPLFDCAFMPRLVTP